MNKLIFGEIKNEAPEAREARLKRCNDWLAMHEKRSRLVEVTTVSVDWLDEGMRLSVVNDGEAEAVCIYYQGFSEETTKLFKNNEALISDLLSICVDLGSRVYVGTNKNNNWSVK